MTQEQVNLLSIPELQDALARGLITQTQYAIAAARYATGGRGTNPAAGQATAAAAATQAAATAAATAARDKIAREIATLEATKAQLIALVQRGGLTATAAKAQLKAVEIALQALYKKRNDLFVLQASQGLIHYTAPAQYQQGRATTSLLPTLTPTNTVTGAGFGLPAEIFGIPSMYVVAGGALVALLMFRKRKK
jgi:hypothetical protein